MRKKIISVLLMLCMVVIALPAAAVPSGTPPVIMTVGNTTVSSADGNMHYWKEENGVYVVTDYQDYQFAVLNDSSQGYTLYLNNVSITTYNNYGIGVDCNGALNIVLMDGTENSVTAITNGIFARNGMGISGSGSLTATAGQYSSGIYSGNGDVTIENGSVTVEGLCGIYAPWGNISITGGTVVARGGEQGLQTFDSVFFSGGSLTAIATDSGGQGIDTVSFSAVATHFKYRTNTSAAEPTTPYQFYPDTAFSVEDLVNYQYVCILPTLPITTPANDYGSFMAAVDGVSTSSAAPNDAVTLTATPNTGYSHVTWSVYRTDDMTVTTAVYGNTFTMPAYPVTADARFTLNTYTVVYFNNDDTGDIHATQTDIPHGGTLTAPTPPTRVEYTFNGWYKESACINPWNFTGETVTGQTNLYAKWIRLSSPSDDGGSFTPPPRTITVTETSSALFANASGEISASANMNNAFSNSVEVKVTDTQEDKANFGFNAGSEVYPFDISLYIRGTNQKANPREGYAVTISLPIPEDLLTRMEELSVVHKSDSGVVTTLASRLEQRSDIWYLVFEATEFSPYALVILNDMVYDDATGVPYYFEPNGNKVFIGFVANGRYIAPEGMSISVMHNGKYFSDVSGHWAARYIGFVTERELFLGTGSNTFSPNIGMTRAMFATVIGRLFERSYDKIKPSEEHAFTDCDYGAYYGKYIDWAAESSIISGYGNSRFGPDDQITREQMAAVLYRFADFLGVTPASTQPVLSYPDADNISDYAKKAALYCQTTGIIGGRTGGMFSPQETASRAEVATIIQRFITLVMK